MKAQHTPGPWYTTVTSDNLNRATRVCSTGDKYGNNQRVIADCGMSTSTVDEANAMLIAAAPDMLEALKRVASETDMCDADQINEKHSSECLGCLINTVIAKAESK